MERSSLPWLIAGAVLVAALLAWWTLTRGGGAAGEPSLPVEHRDLAPFHAIKVGGAATVTLVQSDGESIDVDRGPGVSVKAEVANGRLVVSAGDRGRWWTRFFGERQSRPAHIIVRFRMLDAISLSGRVKLTVPKLEASQLRIAATGGSTLAIDDLRATSLHVSGAGALQAELAGQVDDEHVAISGAGSYRADRLRAFDVVVSVSGVGSVLLRAERTLKASISGAGVIEYTGDPVVTEHVSGIGRVKRRDASEGRGIRVAACVDAHCSASALAAAWSKNSGPPVDGSTSAWMPATKRTSATRQSRIRLASIAATSPTAS